MKHFLAALVVALLLALPGMAAAEGTGMYIEPKLLLSFQNTGNVSRSGAMWGSGVDQYGQFSFGGALAAGYDFWPQQMLPLRAELELALRGNSEKTWNGSANLSEVKATWNSTTLFANLYWDFRNDTIMTPYVGAGIGMAFNYAGYDFIDRGGNKFSADDRTTNFAWNAGGGVGFTINDHFTVDAAYRFVRLGDSEVSASSGGNFYKVQTHPYSNEFTLGLRYGF